MVNKKKYRSSFSSFLLSFFIAILIRCTANIRKPIMHTVALNTVLFSIIQAGNFAKKQLSAFSSQIFCCDYIFYYTLEKFFCQKSFFFKKTVIFVARLLQYNIYNEGKHNAIGVFCHKIIGDCLLQKRKRQDCI